MKKRLLALALGVWPGAGVVSGDHWTVEAYVGGAHNLPGRLDILQAGGYSRSIAAQYDTRGLEKPLYYMLRVGRWSGVSGWEVSFIHHKLYLRNPPSGVSSLSVSHGFNIATVNRAFRAGGWVYRYGAGPVITHAEGIINAIGYDGPYELSGAALLGGGGRRFYLGKRFFLSLETMATGAYADAEMDGPRDAELKMSNIAMHGLAGIGFVF